MEGDNNAAILPCGSCECAAPHCGKFIKNEDGVMLISCFHPFCRDCLSTIVKNTGNYQIQCPLSNLPNQVKCAGYMSLREIREVVDEYEFISYCLRSGHNLNEHFVEPDGNSENSVINISSSSSSDMSLKHLDEDPNNFAAASEIQDLSDEDLVYDLKFSKTETSCGSCKESLKSWEGIILQTCTHVYCKPCLITSITSSNGSQVKCLVQKETNCDGFLLEREIKAIISEEDYKNYKRKSDMLAFNGIPNIYQCAYEGCEARCSVEDAKKVFVCPNCNSKNCLLCKVIHDGLECTEYQKLLKEAIDSGIDPKVFNRELDKELKNGFDQLVKKFYKWKLETGAGSSQSDYENFVAAMALKGLFLSDVEFECNICFDNIAAKEGIILQECMHCLCRNCLIEVVTHANEPEVKCPYEGCGCFLTPREIKALVPEDIYEKYVTRSVQQAENTMLSFHCKTADCPAWCEIESEEQIGEFKCYICQKINCFKCKAIHGEISCEDYQNKLVQNENDIASENELKNLVTSGECMRCPNPTCKVVVQKIVGCDWICCSLCKTEICWATRGPRWGPKGRNDTSGGCRCRVVPNQLCVPNCGNCH